MKNKRHKLPTYAGPPTEHITYRDTELSWFTERALTQNIQHHIWDRESGFNRYNRRGCIPTLATNHQFYKSITPRLSILGVANNLGSVRRFTPDGKYLLSFVPGGIRVLQYSSVAAVQSLLKNVTSECVRAPAPSGAAITYKLFPRYWELKVLPENSQSRKLIRDFCMFLGNRYVILCAKGRMTNAGFDRDAYVYYPDVNDNRDMYEYVYYFIDLENRCLCDEYELCDSSNLSNNYGISVYGNLVALLSLSRQCVQVFEMVDGKLNCIHEINMEEEEERRYFLPHQLQTNGVEEPLMMNMLSPIKQQIFAFLYREAIGGHVRSRSKRVLDFYKNVPNLEHMNMIRIQLLNEDTIFIRFECPTTGDDGSDIYDDEDDDEDSYKLLVFYALTEKKIIRIYPYDSVGLLFMQRYFYDYLRPDRSFFPGIPVVLPSHNPAFNLIFNRAISREGSRTDAAKVFNSILPFNTMGASCSPYLNYNIFNYDDRCISSLLPPKLLQEEPITFEDRLTGLYKFRIHVDTSRFWVGSNSKEKIVSYIAHPYEPFIISAQYFGNRLSLNYHLYCETTVVDRGQRQKHESVLWTSEDDSDSRSSE